MPPKVTYWTGTWDPAKEAISKEIQTLRVGSRARSPVVAFSPAQSFRYVRSDRVLTLNTKSWPLLRGAAAVLERRGDVTHVFGGNSSWHVLRAVGRRPVILTAVVPGLNATHLPLNHVARLVVETAASAKEWTDLGVAGDRVVTIPPGIDLNWFRPEMPPAAGRFTLLFASTPADVGEIEPRGLVMLAELARACPEIDIIVPWREWGDVSAARAAITSMNPPANFRVSFENLADMRTRYRAAHATVVCFDRGVGKVTPNFVIEGFACGRPCLATEGSGLAGELSAFEAGLVVPRSVEALTKGVVELRESWSGFSRRARELAEAKFDQKHFLKRYEDLYIAVTAEDRARKR